MVKRRSRKDSKRRRVSKKRSSKRKVSKKRSSRRKVSKKRSSKRRVSKKSKQRGGSAARDASLQRYLENIENIKNKLRNLITHIKDKTKKICTSTHTNNHVSDINGNLQEVLSILKLITLDTAKENMEKVRNIVAKQYRGLSEIIIKEDDKTCQLELVELEDKISPITELILRTQNYLK